MNRDLDAQIVKEIFDWQYIPVGSDANGENKCQVLWREKEAEQDVYNWLPRQGKIHEGFLAPMYSGDLDLAIQLARTVNLKAEDLAALCLEYFRKKITTTSYEQ